MVSSNRVRRFKEKLISGFRFALRPLTKLLFLGVDGSIANSQNRITIVTNTLAITCSFMNFIQVYQLSQLGVSSDLILYYNSAYPIVPVILYCNWRRRLTVARILVLVGAIYLTLGGCIIYGKTFNGHYGFFVVIIYTIIAFSREKIWLRMSLFMFSFSLLPLVDYFSRIGAIPITNFLSMDFSPYVLYFDSIQIPLFLSLIVLMEFHYSMKYKSELENLKNNLEDLVEKRTESYRIASEEAQKANLRKSQFLANTSHELRTPLQGILGFSHLADKNIDRIEKAKDFNGAVERVRAQLTQVEGNTGRLLDLVEKLLILSRLDSKQRRLVGSGFRVHEEVEKLVANFNALDDEDRIVFISNLDRDTEIITEGSLFRLILDNLIDNAIKHSDSNSKIFLTLNYDGHILNCRVTNRGIGIPEEEAEDIFEAFFQSSRSDQNVGGTGLGLTLSSKYAKFLGGEVKLTNGSPEKTEFLFSLKVELMSEAKELVAA